MLASVVFAGKDYVLIAGERRRRAVRLTGLKTVLCIVEVFENRERMLVQISENLQRHDMSDIDVIRACNILLAECPELRKLPTLQPCPVLYLDLEL